MKGQQLIFPTTMLTLLGIIAVAWFLPRNSDSFRETEHSSYSQALEVSQHATSAMQKPVASTSNTDSTRTVSVTDNKKYYEKPASKQIAPANTNSEESNAPALNSPPESQRLADDEAEKLIVNLNNEFQEEPVDEHWATESSGNIYNYFEQQGLEQNDYSSELRSVECKSSLCKVEVLHESAQAADDFYLRFPAIVGSALPSISYKFEPLPDGRVNVIMFLASQTHEQNQ